MSAARTAWRVVAHASCALGLCLSVPSAKGNPASSEARAASASAPDLTTLAGVPTHPSCKLSTPKANADVRHTVRFEVRAPTKSPFAAVWVFPGSAEPLSATKLDQRAFAATWSTRASADGPVLVELACQTHDGKLHRTPAPHALWVSNTRGAYIGTNGPLSKEHVDSLARDLKVRWIRGGVEWGFHETEADFRRDVKNREAGVTWPALEAFRDDASYAHAHGIRVLALALASPAWAHGADRTDSGNPWHQAVLPHYRQAFAEYAKQLCLEGADAVEILNEPNLYGEYAFGPDHPRHAHPDERVDDYVLLMSAVYRYIKTDPRTASCAVGLGGTAAVGHEGVASDEFMSAVRWYHGLFNARADDRKTRVSVRGMFDFAAVHPYAEANTQDGPTEWSHRWTRFLHVYGDSAYAHGMANVHRIRAELIAGGEAKKELWATEVGVATFGGTCQARPCTSEQMQADWIDQYLRAWMTTEPSGWHAPLAERFYGDHAGPMFFYQWRDRSDGKLEPTDREGFFGLLRYDGTKKVGFDRLAEQAKRSR